MKVVQYVPHGAIPDRRGFAPAIVAEQLARYMPTVQTQFVCAREGSARAHDRLDGFAVQRIAEGRLYRRLFRKLTRLDPYPLHRRLAAAMPADTDVLHAHQLEFPVHDFLRRHQTAVIVHAHVTDGPYNPERGAPAHYIAASNHIRAAMLKLGYPAELIQVIPNGVDIARFAPADTATRDALRTSRGIPAAARVLTFAGRKQDIKGFDLFLSVAEYLLARHDDLVVVAVGPQPADAARDVSFSTTQAQRARLIHDKRFRDVGAVPHAELAAWLQSSDVCLLPSRDEPQGMVMLEAMACGCAVVSTAVGGICESIQHAHSGYLLPAQPTLEEAVALTEATLRGGVEVERLRRQARARVELLYSWDIVAGRVLALYDLALCD